MTTKASKAAAQQLLLCLYKGDLGGALAVLASPGSLVLDESAKAELAAMFLPDAPHGKYKLNLTQRGPGNRARPTHQEARDAVIESGYRIQALRHKLATGGKLAPLKVAINQYMAELEKQGNNVPSHHTLHDQYYSYLKGRVRGSPFLMRPSNMVRKGKTKSPV